MGRRTLGVSLAVALSAGLGVPALVAPAVASASTTPTTFVAGRVADGGAGVGGAAVVAYAWPSQASIAAAGAADLTLLPVATASTAADGSYALSADLAAVPSGYVEPDGVVNMDVYVDGSPMAVAGAADGTRAAALDVGAVSPAHPGVVSLDRATSTFASTVGGRTGSSPAVRTGARAQSAVAGGTVQPAGCTSRTVEDYTGLDEPFLHLYSNTDVPAYVTETTGSEHELGVGFSASGSNWSADGSVTVSTRNQSSLRHGFEHNWTVFNKINYRQYSTTCIINGTGNTSYSRSVRPTGFYDVITSDTALPLMSYQDCRTASPGDVFAKSAGSNLTFSGGIKLGFFSANARAAFSHDTLIEWIPRTSGSDMCGNNTAWFNAQNAGARKTRTTGGCAVPDRPRPSRAVEPDPVC